MNFLVLQNINYAFIKKNFLFCFQNSPQYVRVTFYNATHSLCVFLAAVTIHIYPFGSHTIYFMRFYREIRVSLETFKL